MSEYLRRIESRARSILQPDPSRNQVRNAIVSAATEEVAKLLPNIEATEMRSTLRAMLFERALLLFEEGLRDAREFSPMLKKPNLLAALLGAVEYTGDVRETPLIDDPETLTIALELAVQNWHPRLVPKILQLVLSRHLTLQGENYTATVSIVRRILESEPVPDQIIGQLKSALVDSDMLRRYVHATPISDPILHLTSTGFRTVHLYGQFTQAFVLAWMSSDRSDGKVGLETVRRLTEYSGDAEYRAVLWAHVVQKHAEDPSTWDEVFPHVIDKLPGLGSVALWKIQQRYLSPYQIVLDLARAVLRRWLNREVSRTFFEHLRFHQDRKYFWEPYVESARSVRIAASRGVITSMLSRSTNPEHLRHQFIRGLGDTPALIIEGKTRLFIEFGEEGNATYAYQKDTAEDIINRVRGRNIKELKITSLTGTMREAVYLQNRNVRLLHHEGWEDVYNKIFRLSGEFD